jgi:succinoglycan biosynthesis transport protein ExoP
VPGAIRRYRFAVILVVLACAALGVLYGVQRPHHYKATASVVLQDPRINAIVGSDTAASGNYIPDQVAIMKLPVVVQAAATALGHQTGITPTGITLTADQFLADLTISSTGSNDLVTITFGDSSPAVAEAGANAELRSYEAEVRASQQAQTRLTLANIDQAVINLSDGGKQAIVSGSPTDQLRQQLLALRAEVVANGNSDIGVTAVSPARLPTSPSGTSTALLGIIGGVVGLLVSALVAYLVAGRRPRMDGRLDPELILGAPLITEIADFRDERLRTSMPSRDSPSSAAAEAFRFASSSIAVRQSQADAVTLAVISPSADDGRTTVVANLAVTRAREGARVLVIDADFEHQALTSVLLGDLAPRPGLTDLVDGSCTIDEAVIPVQLGDHTVISLLTCGTAPSGDNLSFPGVRSAQVLAELRARFDLVMVDTPPMLMAAYGVKLALDADLRLVVVRHNCSAADLEELEERLDFATADVVGYVYNRAPLRRPRSRTVGPAAGNGSGGQDTHQRLSADRSAAAMTASSATTANWVPTAAGTAGARRYRTGPPTEPTRGL